MNEILQGDVLDMLATLSAESVNCIITSPPYFGLRDYQLPPTNWPEVSYAPMAGLPEITIPAMSCCFGLEDTIEAYVGHMVLVWRGLWRVLRGDGVGWLNLGDSYSSNASGQNGTGKSTFLGGTDKGQNQLGRHKKQTDNLPPKNLIGIPWRVAFALQADGWYLRSDVIWAKKNCLPECLDPKTSVFIRNKQNGWVSKITLQELSELEHIPQILSHNGWVEIKHIWKTVKPALSMEIGKVERIICSPDHRFPVSSERRTKRTRLEPAENIRHEGYADYLLYCPIDRFLSSSVDVWMGRQLDYQLGYLIGVYAAEGGFEGGKNGRGFRIKLTIGLHEVLFAEKIRGAGKALNLEFSESEDRNALNLKVSKEWFFRTINAFVSGRVKNKMLNIELILNTPHDFRRGILEGYIEGDGSDREGLGWIATSASRRLRDDVSTLASSLGIITSKGQQSQKDKRTGKTYNSHSLWTPYMTKRKTKSGMEDVYQVTPRRRKALDGTREMIDIEVEGGVFLIGDGLITHNSVRDRPTKAHEYLFLLAKSERYWWDQEAIREPATDPEYRTTGRQRPNGTKGVGLKGFEIRDGIDHIQPNTSRNKRTVWHLSSQPLKEAHFAVMPEALVEPCLLAGCPAQVCAECGEPWVRVVEKDVTLEKGRTTIGLGPKTLENPMTTNGDKSSTLHHTSSTKTIAHTPTCQCCPLPAVNIDQFGRQWPIYNTTRPGVVLDPFFGSGTVGVVATQFMRYWLGIELNPDYAKMAWTRLDQTQPALFAR